VSEQDEAGGFKVGDRVDVFEVPGGYVVAASGTLDEEIARHIADAAAPMIDALEPKPEPEVRINWEPQP
jgi:hypothetical protein